MSMQQPHGENGRPLTRRELRELSERQAQAATPAAVPAQPSPIGAPHGGTGSRSFGAATSNAAAPSAPASNSVPFGSASQTSAPQQPPATSVPGLPQRQSVSQFPTQSTFGAPLSASAAAAPRPASSDFARFEQAPVPNSPTLQARPVKAPDREPVQLTRRSMYQVPTAPAVPQVTPPSQAGAVRMLEETGTISKLVDPAQFDPSNTAVAPAVAKPLVNPLVGHTNSSVQQSGSGQLGSAAQHNAASGARTNLSEFMRQAPPSSQIPRVIQDDRGNWTSAEPSVVQQQFENNAAMLPSWGSNSAPFDSRTLGSAQPAFVPEHGNTGNSLPSRVSSRPLDTSMSGASTGFAAGAFMPQAPAPVGTPFTPNTRPDPYSAHGQTQAESLARTPDPQASFAQRPLDIVDQPTAPFQMPDWDAITSVDSSLPQDPTRGGVSITQLTGEIEPVQASINAGLPTPVGGGFSEALGQMGNQTPTSDQSFPPVGLAPSPEVVTPAHGGLTSRLEEDLGDDEEFELDHSYTWLHYLILVAVAFVLGVVIWMVGINPDRHDAPEQEPAASAQSWDIGAGAPPSS